MKNFFTIKMISIFMLLIALTSVSINAQTINSQLDNKIGKISKPIVSNQQAPTTYRDGNVEVTVMMNEFQFPYGMSPNGNYVAIASFNGEQGWLWENPSNLTEIIGYVYDVTDYGMVCGYYTNDSGVEVGGYWLNGQWVFIGMHPDYPQFTGTTYNCVWAMNGDGSKLAGMQYSSEWETFAFTWSVNDGYQNLPDLSNNARPNAISDDGNIVGGWVANEFGTWLPTLWINGELNTLDDEFGGEVNGISPNGQYATGYISTDNQNAFVWSEDNGLQIINNTIFSGFDATAAGVAVSNDGTVFGYANNSFPPFPDTRVAFATNENGEMITFNEYAVAHGWAEAANWTFCQVTSVSPDGNTVTGSGFDADGNGVSFKVNFNTTTNYTLTLVADPVEGGQLIGAGEYPEGESVIIAAIPAENYTFVNWADEDGNIVADTLALFYTMPAQDVTLTAHFFYYDNVSENTSLNATVFPNPASNTLNVMTNEPNVEVKIVDLQGRVVLEQQLPSNSIIDLENLDNGLYFLQLYSDDKQAVTKLQIRH